MAKLLPIIILLYFLLVSTDQISAQTATAFPTFGPTCAAAGPNVTFGPTCEVTAVPTATVIPATSAPPRPTATPAPVRPTPTPPVTGNLEITLVFMGIAAFSVIAGITGFLASSKSS